MLNRTTIYVELDALLDTRLAVINTINPKIASDLAISDEYQLRDTDRFEGINNSEFLKKWKNRDITILKNSMLTNMYKAIQNTLDEVTNKHLRSMNPDTLEKVIVINTFPYILSEDIHTSIKQAVFLRIARNINISVNYISPECLTPEYCSNNYNIMIMYEYDYWLNMHSDAFTTKQIPDVSLLVPGIFFEEKPDKKVMDDLLKLISDDITHPFQGVEQLLRPLIDLQLIDVSYFSIVTNN